MPQDIFTESDACERFMGRWSRRLAPHLVTFACVSEQDALLDIGSGTGALAFTLAVAAPSGLLTGGEMIRMTRPGGAVAAAVWDYGQGMEMLRVFWDEAVALDPAIAPRDERNMPLCRRGELAALWRAQGLERVDEQPIAIDLDFDSFDDYWRPFLGGQGPAGADTAALPERRRAALEARLRSRLLGDRSDGPITLQARAWAVKGVVPAR